MVVDPLESISNFSSKTNLLPNLKWQFFLFGTAIKDFYSRSKYSKFSLLFFLIRIYLVTSSSLYFISSLSEENYGTDDEFEIFPNSTLLSLITPGIFTRATFLAIMAVFIIITLYSLVYCFFNVDQIPKFFAFINPDLHSILFPTVIGTVSYVIYIIFSDHFDNIAFYILCAVLFVLFTPYLIGHFAFGFLFQNTLFKPNTYITRFFCLFHPHIIIMNIFVIFNTFNLTRYNVIVRYIALNFNLVVCIVYICITWYELPFSLYIVNELTIAETATVSLVCILSQLVHIEGIFGKNVINWIGPLTPIIYLFFLQVAHVMCDRRGKKYIRYLENFEKNSVISHDILSEVFESLNKENDFYLLTIFGLQNSYYVTSTQEYAGFLLEKYPNKEWVIKYVVFMYSSVWGMTDDTYRIFLHYLSTDNFSLSTQMVLFESIYCYLQISKNKSPIIQKEMNKLTDIIMQYAFVSKQLWSHKPDVPEDLYDDISIVHEALLSCNSQIKKMMFLFPFCPDVYFFQSIFEADFKKNFEKASKSYEQGLLILNNRQNYVTHELNGRIKSHVNYTPNVKLEVPVHKKQDYFTFLSISNHRQDSSIIRNASIKSDNEFLEVFSKTYSAERNQLLTPTPIIKKWFLTTHIWVFLFLLVLIFLSIYLMVLFKMSINVSERFGFMFNFTLGMQSFVEDIHRLHFEYMVEKDSYDSNFRDFIIAHMKESFESFVNFSSILGTIDIKTINQENLYAFIKIIHVAISDKKNVFLADTLSITDIKNDILEDVFITSKELIKFWKNNVMDKYRTIIQTTDSLIVFIIFVVLFNIIAINLFNMKLKEVLFTVFSTIQYHVRKVVEKQFDFILESRDPSLAPPKKSSLGVPIFWNIICCSMILFCFVLFRIILSIFITNSDYEFIFDEIINISISFNGFKEHALREHKICPYYNNCTHNGSICIDSYFNFYNNSELHFLSQQFSESNFTKIVLIICLIFTFYFYFKFLKTFRIIMKIYDECNYTLFSIPTNIRRSNYIFNMIITGGKMSDNKAKQYSEELKEPHIDFNNFGTVKFDEDGNCIEVVGNVEGIFGIIPINYKSLIEKMANDGISETAINKMFDEKDSNKEVFGIGEREYSASFIENDKVLFRDNSGNKYTTRPDIFDLLSSVTPRKDIAAQENACIFLFSNVSKSDSIRITNYIEEHFKDLILLDSNESHMAYIFDMNIDKERKIYEVREYLRMIKDDIINKEKCIVTFGGLVSSRANKKQIEKKKFFGKAVNDSIMILINTTNPGLYVQTELLDLTETEYSKDDVIQFKTTTGSNGRYINMVCFH